MNVICLAIQEGRISIRRAAGLLDLDIEEVADLFATYGIEHPADL